ncbi:MAG: hypothetical protein ACRYF2_10190 [Janthinobacterium lividum]
MDWLTFVASMSGTLAWPLVAITALIIFRVPFRTLVSQSGKRKVTVKGGGAEVVISEELDRIEETSPSTLKIENKTPQNSDQTVAENKEKNFSNAFLEALAAEVELPPAYIISQSWLRLIDEVRLALQYAGVEASGRGIGSVVILSRAHTAGFLSSDEFQQLQDLRKLRNQVVHDSEVSVSSTDALRYSTLANRLIERFRNTRTRLHDNTGISLAS